MPPFLVCHVLSWRERYVRNYVFAFCACGWGLVLSTKLLAGKVCFYVFMCFKNEPVDKACIFLRRDILGFSLFLCAKLLVTIPSYVYFSDGYHERVQKKYYSVYDLVK